MNPVETQVAEYFSWLEAEVRQPEPIPLRSAQETIPSGRRLMLAVAAGLLLIVAAVSFVIYRQDDVAPERSPDTPSTTPITTPTATPGRICRKNCQGRRPHLRAPRPNRRASPVR